MKTTHYLLAALLFITGFTAAAQTWTGSWNSSFGELRLHQIGIDVYGDYRDLGDIDGRVNGNKLTGTFTNGNKSGSFIFTLANNNTSFTGKWKWSTSNNWQDWNGSLKSSAAPVLVSPLALNKKREKLNSLTGSQKIHFKFQYATFNDKKSNPDVFSIYGSAVASLDRVENGRTTNYMRGPRIMNKSEDSPVKTKRTSSGTKLINFNKDYIIEIPNKDYFDPANSFILETVINFKSKGFFSNGDFGTGKMKTNIKTIEPNKSYSVKSSKGNLISNLFFTLKK